MSHNNTVLRIFWKISNLDICFPGRNVLSPKFLLSQEDVSPRVLVLKRKDSTWSFYLTNELGFNLPVAETLNRVSCQLSLLDDCQQPWISYGPIIHFNPNNEQPWISNLGQADLAFKKEITLCCSVRLLDSRRQLWGDIYLNTRFPTSKFFLTFPSFKGLRFRTIFLDEVVDISICFVFNHDTCVDVKITFFNFPEKLRSFDMSIQDQKNFFFIQNRRFYPQKASLHLPINVAVVRNATRFLMEEYSEDLYCNIELMSQEYSVSYTDTSNSFAGNFFLANVDTTNSKSVSNNQVSFLHKDILHMYKEKILTDFSVRVDSQIFPVHSTILAGRSPVFYRILDSDMKEKRERILDIDDLSSQATKQLLDYLYSDNAGELNDSNAMELYYAADKYEIIPLKRTVSMFLLHNISISNVLDILHLSDRHSDNHLKSSAIHFIYQFEKEVMLSENFKEFSKNRPDLLAEVMVELTKLRFNADPLISKKRKLPETYYFINSL